VLGNNPRRAPSMGLIWIVLVSADGLEPSTHALKGSSSLDSGCTNDEHEWRLSPVSMQVGQACRLSRILLLIPANHPHNSATTKVLWGNLWGKTLEYTRDSTQRLETSEASLGAHRTTTNQQLGFQLVTSSRDSTHDCTHLLVTEYASKPA
jgi:hypothetical protein